MKPDGRDNRDRSQRYWLAIGILSIASGLAGNVACVATFSNLMDVADQGFDVSGHGAYTFLSRIALWTLLIAVGILTVIVASLFNSDSDGSRRWQLGIAICLAILALGQLVVIVIDLVLEFGQRPLLPAFNQAMIPLQVTCLVLAFAMLVPLVLFRGQTARKTGP